MYQIVFGFRGQERLFFSPLGELLCGIRKNGIRLDLSLTGRYTVEHTSPKSPPVAL